MLGFGLRLLLSKLTAKLPLCVYVDAHTYVCIDAHTLLTAKLPLCVSPNPNPNPNPLEAHSQALTLCVRATATATATARVRVRVRVRVKARMMHMRMMHMRMMHMHMMHMLMMHMLMMHMLMMLMLLLVRLHRPPPWHDANTATSSYLGSRLGRLIYRYFLLAHTAASYLGSRLGRLIAPPCALGVLEGDPYVRVWARAQRTTRVLQAVGVLLLWMAWRRAMRPI